MSNEILNYFRQSITEILSENGLNIAKDESLERNNASYEIISTVGLTGFLGGYLVFQTTRETGHGITDNLLRSHGIDNNGDEQLFRETFNEIVNQTGGRTGNKLSSTGRDMDITPPTFLSGDNISFDFTGLSEVHTHRFHLDEGAIDVSIGLKK